MIVSYPLIGLLTQSLSLEVERDEEDNAHIQASLHQFDGVTSKYSNILNQVRSDSPVPQAIAEIANKTPTVPPILPSQPQTVPVPPVQESVKTPGEKSKKDVLQAAQDLKEDVQAEKQENLNLEMKIEEAKESGEQLVEATKEGQPPAHVQAAEQKVLREEKAVNTEAQVVGANAEKEKKDLQQAEVAEARLNTDKDKLPEDVGQPLVPGLVAEEAEKDLGKQEPEKIDQDKKVKEDLEHAKVAEARLKTDEDKLLEGGGQPLVPGLVAEEEVFEAEKALGKQEQEKIDQFEMVEDEIKPLGEVLPTTAPPADIQAEAVLDEAAHAVEDEAEKQEAGLVHEADVEAHAIHEGEAEGVPAAGLGAEAQVVHTVVGLAGEAHDVEQKAKKLEEEVHVKGLEKVGSQPADVEQTDLAREARLEVDKLEREIHQVDEQVKTA